MHWILFIRKIRILRINNNQCITLVIIVWSYSNVHKSWNTLCMYWHENTIKSQWIMLENFTIWISCTKYTPTTDPCPDVIKMDYSIVCNTWICDRHYSPRELEREFRKEAYFLVARDKFTEQCYLGKVCVLCMKHWFHLSTYSRLASIQSGQTRRKMGYISLAMTLQLKLSSLVFMWKLKELIYLWPPFV